MKKIYQTLIILALAFYYPLKLGAQFSGAYAPANWGTALNNSNGTINTSGAPTSIVIVSSNNLSFTQGTTDFTITIPQSGLLSFDWGYTTVDGANWDYPMFVINGVATQVNGYVQIGGSSTQSGSQPCISVTAGQTFALRAHSVDNQGGVATCTFSNFAFSTGNLTVTPASASVCPGGQVTFTTAGGGGNYSWSGGITEGVAFTPTASMIYTVTAGSGLCISTKTASVVYNPPLAILGPTGNICANASATLTGQGGTTYTWSTGAVSPSIVITPSSNVTYTISGISSQGCNTQGVRTFTIDPTLPVVTASASSAAAGVCPGKTLTLNGGGATTYTWTGPFPVTNGVPFAPGTSGDYTVNGTNACGTTSASISVSIHVPPNVTAVASSPSLCSGSSLTLTAVGNATSVVWSGGPVAIADGVGFFPNSTITYSVIGTSALTCTTLATVPVTVVTTPILAPTKTPSIVCLGGTTTLTASGATNYTWTSATQTVFTNPFIITPTAPGVETFTVTKANSNCYDTKTISVITNALPNVFALATPTLVCSMSQATLAVAGGQSYTWTAPGFGPVIVPSPIVTPSVNTVYTVAAHDGTCVNTTTVLIATNPIPTISISGSTNMVCKGSPVTMTATGGLTHTWTSSPSTTTLVGNSISQSPTVTTAFTAVGVNGVGCTSSALYFVQVNNLPNVGGTVTKTLVCSGGLSTLTATGANSYTWDPINVFTPSTVVSTTATVSGPVIYTVTGLNTTTGCQNTKTLQVTVFVPVLTISGGTNTCMGGPISLQGGGGNVGSYSWNTGSGTPVNLQTITTTLTAASIFTLSATTTSASVNCPGTKTVQLGIYFNPSITATPQKTFVCKGETFELYGTGGVSYDWSNGMQGSTVTVGPITNVQTLNYTVTGTDANGCANTATAQVKVSGCSGINEVSGANSSVLIYPNPNNGIFTIQADKDMILTLSNELGQVIRTIGLSGINSREVSVTDLAKGIYFISGQGINQKIIVAK